MNHWLTALLGATFLLYSLVGARLATSVLTGPMLFAALGLVLGPEVLGWFEFGLETALVETILSVTLGLLLFADATRIDLPELVRSYSIPGRLLTIGLPLTILLGTLAGVWLFGVMDVWAAALLAAVLAPTDAALGEAVVTNRSVPVRVRQGLNVESGLNDGIVLPFVTIFLVIAESGTVSGRQVARTLLEDLGIAILVGVAVGLVAGWLVARFTSRGWMSKRWSPLAGLATPALAFGLAEPLGGSGFVATFVAGLAFGVLARGPAPEVDDFVDDLAQLLVPATFLIFGGAVLTPALSRLDWQTLVYVSLSLTLIRMLPTALALLGTGFRSPTVALMGWFGPRGLASILFAVILVEESGHFDGLQRLTDVVAWTVATSILLHGLSAWPLSNAYGRWVERRETDSGLAETKSARVKTHARYFERDDPK